MARKSLSDQEIYGLLFEPDSENINENNGNSSESDSSDSDIGSDESDSDLEQPKKRRKVLTYQRLVSSVDSSLDVANYNSYDPKKECEEQYVCTLVKKTKKTPEINIKWTNGDRMAECAASWT